MRKFLSLIVGVVAGVLLGGVGSAFATGAFDNSTPPTPRTWMVRPCLDTLTGIPLRQNCYWNDNMGLTDAQGNDIGTGFWIRKVPHQNLTCYFFSPDDTNPKHHDHCFGNGAWTRTR